MARGADDYQSLENPLAPALSGLMKRSRLGSVAQKYQSLRAMALSGIDPARLALLTNVVESYLSLDPGEQDQFSRLVQSPEGSEVRNMPSDGSLNRRRTVQPAAAGGRHAI